MNITTFRSVGVIDEASAQNVRAHAAYIFGSGDYQTIADRRGDAVAELVRLPSGSYQLRIADRAEVAA